MKKKKWCVACMFAVGVLLSGCSSEDSVGRYIFNPADYDNTLAGSISHDFRNCALAVFEDGEKIFETRYAHLVITKASDDAVYISLDTYFSPRVFDMSISGAVPVEGEPYDVAFNAVTSGRIGAYGHSFDDMRIDITGNMYSDWGVNITRTDPAIPSYEGNLEFSAVLSDVVSIRFVITGLS